MILTPYSNKRVLVTGGAGFIGSHLVEALVKLQAHVTVLDNLSTGNIGNLIGELETINLMQGDITDAEMCQKAAHHVDIIFHLAALVSPQKSLKNPELCEEINLGGTRNILEAARVNNIKTVVFASSAAVYGEQEICTEESLPNPATPYAETKLKGEELCRTYARKYGLSCISLRYFNVYGPRQNPHSAYAAVIAKFSHALKEGNPLTIFGSGKQVRDFVHVSRVVQANLKMGLQQELEGEVFNIATGKSIDLFTLINQLKAQYEVDTIEINYEPALPGDIMISRADCTKYQNFASGMPDFAVESKKSKFPQQLNI